MHTVLYNTKAGTNNNLEALKRLEIGLAKF